MTENVKSAVFGKWKRRVLELERKMEMVEEILNNGKPLKEEVKDERITKCPKCNGMILMKEEPTYRETYCTVEGCNWKVIEEL